MPITLLQLVVADNHWCGQKPSTEKSAIGNEPYIKGAAVLGGSFVILRVNCK